MTQVNRYKKRAHISEYKFRQIVRHFSLDLTASQTAKLTNINRNTINKYLMQIRQNIAEYCEQQSPFSGEIEVDESYFGARRVKGIRGRGARGKTIVFGIFQRNGKVYTEIVPDCKSKTLQAIIRGKVSVESIIHSDTWRGYSSLVDLGYQKHYRVKHGINEFVNGKSHINGIESFWAFAKTRLSKFRGLNKNTFYMHLKESEFRFNHRNDRNVLDKIILKIIRENPLN